jgi:hypothetical protein
MINLRKKYIIKFKIFSYEKYSAYNLIQAKKNNINNLVKACDIQEFEVNFLRSECEYEKGSALNKNDATLRKKLNRTSWMLSDIEKLEPDPIVSCILARNGVQAKDKEIDSTFDTEQQQQSRPVSLFDFYLCPNSQASSLSVEYRMDSGLPTEVLCNRILVKCTHLKFDLDIEPIWASMALYDLNKKKKVSENFYFDLNTESMKQMLNTHQTHQDHSTTARSCIFNITYPSVDLFLVIRIEKVLQQGDISECAEPYVKTHQQSASSIEKLKANAAQFCDRLGKFRMPFAWTAINICNILNANPQNESASSGGASLTWLTHTSNSSDLNSNTITSTSSNQKSSSLDRVLANPLNMSSMNVENTQSTSKGPYENTKKFQAVAMNTVRDESITRRSNSMKEAANTRLTNSLSKFLNANGTNNEIQSITSSVKSGVNNDELAELRSTLSTFKPVAISINAFFKQESEKLSDEDLYRCLNELKKSTGLMKKLKCVPGSLKMEFSPLSDDDLYAENQKSLYSLTKSIVNNLNLSNSYILSPELQHIKTTLAAISQSNSCLEPTHSNHYQHHLSHHHQHHQSILNQHQLLPIKDILEFPSQEVFEPNSIYRNLLYVYPLSININNNASTKSSMANFTNTGIGSGNSSLSARNIAIKVNFMKGEEEHCALPVLFAKSSSTLEYTKEVFVNVIYHNKSPQYYDEVKIKLPALLTGSNYHLLFTFYHISCQNQSQCTQNIIGYSWLPIQQQFQFETIVNFVNAKPNLSGGMNDASNSSMSVSYQHASVASSSSANLQPSAPQFSSFLSGSSFASKTSRCFMAKSGVYSLPIIFDKLSPGYSKLNYSVYGSSTSASVTNLNSSTVSSVDNQIFQNNNDEAISSIMDRTIESINDLNSSNISNSNNNNKSLIDNISESVHDLLPSESSIINFSTQVTNMNSINSQYSTLSLASNQGAISASTAATAAATTAASLAYSKSYFDVRIKISSTTLTQDVYLERFLTIANMIYSTSMSINEINNLYGSTKISIGSSNNAQVTATPIVTCNLELLLKNSIMDICYAEAEALVQFINIILDKLFNLMINLPNLSLACLEAISRIVQKLTDLNKAHNDVHNRNRLLIQYIQYNSNIPIVYSNMLNSSETSKPYTNQSYFHEDLLSILLGLFVKRNAKLVNSQNNKRLCNLIISNSWFFLELLYKSIVFYLDSIPMNESHSRSKANRPYGIFDKKLNENFLEDLNKLICILIIEVVNMTSSFTNVPLNHQSFKQLVDSTSVYCAQMTTNIRMAYLLNNSLSFFLSDLLGVVDRSLVFGMLELYLNETNKALSGLLAYMKNFQSFSFKSDKSHKQCLSLIYRSYKSLSSMQLDFLRIISNNEHFITLNIPTFVELSQIYADECFNHGTNSINESKYVTSPIKLIIESNDFYRKHFLIGSIFSQIFKHLHSFIPSVQFKAVELFRNILEAHDADPRLKKDIAARSRIAYMYFPFVSIIMHFIPFMSKLTPIKTQKMPISQSSSSFEMNRLEPDDLITACGSYIVPFENIDELNLNLEISNDLSSEYLVVVEKLEKMCSFQDEIAENGECNEKRDEANSDLRFCHNDVLNAIDDISMSNNKKGHESSRYRSKSSTNSKQRSATGSGKSSKKLSNGTGQQPSLSSASQFQTQLGQIALSAQQEDIELNPRLKSNEPFMAKYCECFATKIMNIGSEDKPAKNYEKLNFTPDVTRNLLACFMWILKNIDKKLLFYIYNRWSYYKLNKILLLIDLSTSHFEYKPYNAANELNVAGDLAQAAQIGNGGSMINKSLSSSSGIKKNQTNKLKNKIEDLLIGSQLRKYANNTQTMPSLTSNNYNNNEYMSNSMIEEGESMCINQTNDNNTETVDTSELYIQPMARSHRLTGRKLANFNMDDIKISKADFISILEGNYDFTL